MLNKDELGDRMKMYEKAECGRRFMPTLPVIVRIDGKCFSRYTKNLRRPYDASLISIFQEVTRYLVEETRACIGYTQSDEITLVLYTDSVKSQIYFDGKIQKITSVISSLATAKFNQLASRIFGDEVSELAFFDCRAWQVPTLMEATNAVLWRELDASKNSVSMLARAHFSHHELQDKTCSQMQDMLMVEKGINWNNEPPHFKRGTYYQRRKVMREFTKEELKRIPASFRPAGPIERTDVVMLDMPPITTVANREGVIFRGEDPVNLGGSVL